MDAKRLISIERTKTSAQSPHAPLPRLPLECDAPSAWIDALHDDRWRTVSDHMLDTGVAVRSAACDGLSNLDWRVRAGCASYLDHFANDESVMRLILVMHDPKLIVRQLATHSAACHGCKPSHISVDVVAPLIRRLDEDLSIRVRRMASVMLAFQPPERRITRRLHRVLREETDARLRRSAHIAVHLHSRGFFLDGRGRPAREFNTPGECPIPGAAARRRRHRTDEGAER